MDNGDAKDSYVYLEIMPKYIHILTHEYPPMRGGAGTYCYELAFSVSKIGQSVKIWGPLGSQKSAFFELEELSWKGSQSVISSWQLVNRVRKFIMEHGNGDVFHLAELGSSRAFLRFGWMIPKNIKFILTIHGSELLRFSKNPIEKWLFKKLMLKCQRIHVLSQFNRQKLLEFFPKIKHKICLSSGAPSSNLLNNHSEPKPTSNSPRINILCVGRIHPRKGQDQIFKALNLLTEEEQKKIALRIVGPKTKPRFFKSLAEISRRFRGEVIFEGDCTDEKLSELYSSSDIFVLTSMPLADSVEGFGFVYLDASSHGLPVIANRTGGVEEAVIDGKTGWLAEPGDIHQLSRLLLDLINNQQLRDKLGQEGKRWAKTHSWNRVTKELYQLG